MRLETKIRIQNYGIPVLSVAAISILDATTSPTVFQYFRDPISSNFLMPLLTIIIFFFLYAFVYVGVSRLWNILTPIKSENVVETFLVRLLCYSVTLSLIGFIFLRLSISISVTQFYWVLLAQAPVAIAGTIIGYSVKRAIDASDTYEMPTSKPLKWQIDKSLITPSLIFAALCSSFNLIAIMFTKIFPISMALMLSFATFVLLFISVLFLNQTTIDWGQKLISRLSKLDDTKWIYHSTSYLMGLAIWGIGVLVFMTLLFLGSGHASDTWLPKIETVIVILLSLPCLIISSLVYGFSKQKQLNQNVDGVFD